MTMQEITRVLKNGQATLSAEGVAELVDRGLGAVERLMNEVTDSEVTVLRDASRHILSSGGKRVRPRMTILSYLAAGGRDVERVAAVASAVELVHTASVVHDDINDHGVLRRGKPSVNSIWGRTFALLTGDFLFTKVYELMAPYKDLNIILAEATVALVEGETLQASAVKENNLNREIYYRIIGLKTAALFKASAKLGASLADASDEQIEALGEYGFQVGLAFQIIDDILDLTADSEQLGKTAGIDLEQGRGFGAAYAVEHGNTPATDPMEAIKRKLLEGGAVDEGVQQAKALVEQAKTHVDIIPPSPARDALFDLAHMVVNRRF